MLDFEYRMLIGSMKGGREHDVTMFIRRDGGYVGIQKPMYRHTGIFRAPSGGLKPGESLEEGVKREVYEETGLKVVLERFILIISTEFTGPDGSRRNWKSYVFTGCPTGGKLETRDSKEISGIKIITREEMLGPIAAEMEASGWGGFAYRARLTRESFRIIDSFQTGLRGK